MVYTSTQCVSCRTGLAETPATQCSRCLAAGTPVPPPPAPPQPPEPPAAISLRPLLQAIELVVAKAKRLHPDLPRVVVALGPGDIGRGEALGWHSPEAWKLGEAKHSEILVGAEGLERGPRDVLTTVLHELAHALALGRGLKDTSRKGEYHNGTFARLAREIGLMPPEKPSKIGFSACVLPSETELVYGPELAALESVLTMHRVSYGKGGRGGGAGGGDATDAAKPKRVKASCGCATPRSFYMVATALELADITCGACGQSFEAPEV